MNVLEDLLIITAQCNNFGNIQVIVMQAFYGDVHKVHINQSTDLHTSVTIPVEKSGEYQVSIFAIREGIGILDSDLLHIERVTLTEVIKATSNDAVTPTTTPTTTNTTSTQSEGIIPRVKKWTSRRVSNSIIIIAGGGGRGGGRHFYELSQGGVHRQMKIAIVNWRMRGMA